MNHKPFLIVIYLTCVVALLSCKKYLEVGPPRVNLTGQTVFASNSTATAAMLSVYIPMEQSGIAHNLTTWGGIASDELTNYSTSASTVAIASNNITPENGNINTIWTSLYQYIYRCNSVIEGTTNNQNLTETVRRQLQGEAYFVRAFCHFQLLNFFGNIPYNKVTDYAVTSTQAQQDATAILPQLIADLQLSKSLLREEYVKGDNTPGTDRIRPNKWAAAALLARVYLFSEQWARAEAETDTVLQKPMYALNPELQQVFRSTSSEVIWQLQPVVPGFNSYAGAVSQPTAFRPFFFSLAQSLVDSFETGDKRKTAWVTLTTYSGQNYSWLHKYKVGQNAPTLTEFTTLIRLAEVYLVRAEARARQDKITLALEDVNRIRDRAGLPGLILTLQEDVVRVVLKERRLELFGEFPHRWFDLTRTNQANTVMPVIKGTSWSSTDQLFPIPQNEMLRHPGMIQNQGY